MSFVTNRFAVIIKNGTDAFDEVLVAVGLVEGCEGDAALFFELIEAFLGRRVFL